MEMIAAEIAAHPALLTLGADDGPSNAGSSNGTPRASVAPGGTKLKLTFAANGGSNGNGE